MIFLLTLVFIFILLLILLVNKFSYWKIYGIECLPISFFLNHIKKAFFQENSFADRDKNIYDYIKNRGLKHIGMYFLYHPLYVPIDLNIVKNILQSDHFLDRGFYVNEKDDPLSAHLFSLAGPKWKNLRKKVTPTFTSGKLKMMFDTLIECTINLKKVMDKDIDSAVDIKDILARYTTDIIGSCAFGLDCNSLENPNSEFRLKGRIIFHRNFYENTKQILLYAFPNFMRFLKCTIVNNEVTEFFMDVVKKTIDHREKNNIFRKDFMHLLIQLKNFGKLSDDKKLNDESKEESNRITFDEIAAQAFIFFEAGFETSSSTMAFCLYELASNIEIQKKVRKEISECSEDLTYESVTGMKYLDNVVYETLRKYPPLTGLYRRCLKDFHIPETKIVLKEGMRIMIPIYGIQNDPEYYPNPEVFDPERFSDENKKIRPDFTFLPFGSGPRLCIGMRFGLLQIKVGLIALLRNYEFSVSKRTKLPLEFDPQSVMMSTKGDLWLEYKKIQSSSD